jgi:uncharacterized OB-fold protein
MTITAANPTQEELQAFARTAREHEDCLKQQYEAHKAQFGEGPPYFSEATAGFWSAIGKGSFTLSKCSSCKHVYFPPRVVCPQCWESDAGESYLTAGTGTLVTFTDLFVTAPKLRELAPLRMAIVDLDEGVRVLTWLRGPNSNDASVGDRCRIVVEKIYEQNWFVANLE